MLPRKPPTPFSFTSVDTSFPMSRPMSAIFVPKPSPSLNTRLNRLAGWDKADPTDWDRLPLRCLSLKADIPGRACSLRTPSEQAAAAHTGRLRLGPRSRSWQAGILPERTSSSSAICHSSTNCSGLTEDNRCTVTPLPVQTKTIVPSGVQCIFFGVPLQLSSGCDPSDTPSMLKRCKVVTFRSEFGPCLTRLSQTVTINP
mmetsp:Transcript_22210/g.61725  ORF Transcript_22210/g.61725 Transcript_22210/m.61725 type:complete len:200 (+) Transcript_22210:111-710(+)